MNPKTQQKGTTRSKTAFPQPRTWPGQKYWILLITTIILLVSFAASFFVLLLTETDGYSTPAGSNTGNINNRLPSKATENGTDDENADADMFVTVPSMDNYVSTPSAFVKQLDGLIEPTDIAHESNNTILVEIGDDSCTSIAEKSADAKIYPASMTKVMSLIIACENLKNLNTKLVVTEEHVQYMNDQGGSGVGLIAGQTLTVEDCLYLTSYQSDTVAVIMLAEHVAGSEDKFVKLMNEKARALGLNNTSFSNCTGLHDENNYTTCREMAAIMTYALDNPLCYELLTSYNGYKLTLKVWDSEEEKHIEKECEFYSSWYSGKFSDNPRLGTVTVTAGKTGYIDESGFCLVTYAVSRASGRKYVNVIVGKPKGSGLTEVISTNQVKTIYNTYAE